MKTQSFLVTVAVLLVACQPKKETDFPLEQLDLNSAALSAALEGAMPEVAYDKPAEASEYAPKVSANVKFVPPVIKDDAVEESAGTNANSQTLSKNKKIIKDGSISIKVKDVEAAKKRMDAIVKTHEAYYENESFQNYEYRISYTLKVRVPSKKFESFLNASEHSDGEVMSKDINARDVTEEYVDSETRLNSKRLFRTRYNQLLGKASKVDDILAIEENIRGLQEEIESQEGHLKFLDDQVSYSTLDITLFHEKVIEKSIKVEDSFTKRFKTSLTNGWNSLVGFLLWCMMQWPWYIVIAFLVVSIKLYLRRRRNSRAQ